MIKGLIAPILSPFNDDKSFNQELFNELAAELLSTGCAGLAPFGTSGEALSMSSAERMTALEGLVKSGIDPGYLVPGTGLCNLPETIALSQHAVELGCAGVMTLPPFYFKGLADDGYFDYFSKLIENIDHPSLKIHLYNVPQVSGVGLSIELVQRISSAYPEVVVGIKDSAGDWNNTQQLLAMKGITVYPGTELNVIEAIRLGGPGCISATANVNGNNIAQCVDLCHASQWDQANSLHKSLREVWSLFHQGSAPIPALKAILAHRTREPRWNNLRSPFRPISDQSRHSLIDSLESCGMTF